ncbi:MAG: zf-HC2 domain-containing protein [Acidobacteria bacterium]|nr:zf-HC2 domain-containing protein [Acidobacteriota bacterium]
MESRSPAEDRCGRYAALVQDLVDGDLAPDVRADLDRHVAGCPACLALLADLREIRRGADDLPRHTPRRLVWEGIARQIAAEQASRRRVFWTGTRVALALAATLVVAVASSVWVLRAPPATTAAPGVTTAGTAAAHQSKTDLVQDVDEHLRVADEHYEKAIAGLEAIVKSDQGALDPAVAATLQKNLGVIDVAIQESRAAIKSQPHSELAQTSLFEALRQKVALLEDTIALINVMRKGDQAGAAKLLGGMSKS